MDQKTENVRQPGTGRLLLQRMPAALKALGPSALYLTLLGMSIPTLCFNALLGAKGFATAQPLIDRASALPPTQSPNFIDLFTIMADYAGVYFLGGVALLLICGASYLAILKQARSHFEGKAVPGVLKSFGQGLKLFLTKGMFALFMVSIFLSATQALPFFSLTIATLFLMVPVLLVWEGQGVLKTLWHTITLRFLRGTGGFKLHAFFQIFTVSTLFFAAIVGTVYLGRFVLNLDEVFAFARTPWSTPIGGTPFALNYLVSSVVVVLMSSLAVMLFGVATTALYAELKKSSDWGQTRLSL